MRKTILALIAAALVGAGSVTSASAAEGMGGLGAVGGFGAVGSYPGSFGSNTEGRGNCRLVAHRVKTPHGWRVRRVQVCS